MVRRNCNRSSNRRRHRRRSSRLSSTVALLSTAIRAISSSRSLTFIPKQVLKDSDKPTDSWLEKALPYATIVMKLFGALLVETGLLAAKVYVSSTVQGILFGAEDILFDHPITYITELVINNKKTNAMTIDYSIVRLHSVKVVVSLMGASSARAGRLAVMLKSLSREKSEELLKADLASRETGAESKDFQQLAQTPGCVVSPNLRPITIVKRTSGFAAQPHEVGDPSRPTGNASLVGGLPLYQMLVGYQDLASDSADPHLMYGLSEAALCVEISGVVSLEAPVLAGRFLRSAIRVTSASENITLTTDIRRRIEVPLQNLERQNGSLILHLNRLSEESKSIIGFPVEEDFETLAI
jgi:hypothetical protein